MPLADLTLVQGTQLMSQFSQTLHRLFLTHMLSLHSGQRPEGAGNEFRHVTASTTDIDHLISLNKPGVPARDSLYWS